MRKFAIGKKFFKRIFENKKLAEKFSKKKKILLLIYRKEFKLYKNK